jgi:hypothetical protein
LATTQTLGPAPDERAPDERAPEQEPAQLVGPVSEDLRARIAQETHEIECDCRVAVRCHAAATTRWTVLYYALGLPTVVFAALAGLTALKANPWVAAGLAIAATISATVNTFLNAGQIANAHAKKRSEYEQLKNEVRHFRNITLQIDRPAVELIRELVQYSHSRDVLNLASPQVSSRTYRSEKRKLAEEGVTAPPPRPPGSRG